MKNLKNVKERKMEMTSFHDVTIDASVNDLKAILGEPEYAGNDGRDKVNYQWRMENKFGDMFTVYDWKHYRPLKGDATINWHIGGISRVSELQGRNEMIEAFGAIEDQLMSEELERISLQTGYYEMITNALDGMWDEKKDLEAILIALEDVKVDYVAHLKNAFDEEV